MNLKYIIVGIAVALFFTTIGVAQVAQPFSTNCTATTQASCNRYTNTCELVCEYNTFSLSSKNYDTNLEKSAVALKPATTMPLIKVEKWVEQPDKPTTVYYYETKFVHNNSKDATEDYMIECKDIKGYDKCVDISNDLANCNCSKTESISKGYWNPLSLTNNKATLSVNSGIQSNIVKYVFTVKPQETGKFNIVLNDGIKIAKIDPTYSTSTNISECGEINGAGYYNLNASLYNYTYETGNCLTVTASDVYINCREFGNYVIEGPANNSGNGIYANNVLNNFTVDNCYVGGYNGAILTSYANTTINNSYTYNNQGTGYYGGKGLYFLNGASPSYVYNYSTNWNKNNIWIQSPANITISNSYFFNTSYRFLYTTGQNTKAINNTFNGTSTGDYDCLYDAIGYGNYSYNNFWSCNSANYDRSATIRMWGVYSTANYNNITDGKRGGIVFSDSANNVAMYNNVTNDGYGCVMSKVYYPSVNDTCSNNRFINVAYGGFTRWAYLTNFSNNYVEATSRGCYAYGVPDSFGQPRYIINNTFIGIGSSTYYGLYASHGDYLTVINNTWDNFRLVGIYSNYGDNNTFIGNTVSGTWYSTPHATYGPAISQTYGNNDYYFNNSVYNNTQDDVRFEYNTNVTFENMLFSNHSTSINFSSEEYGLANVSFYDTDSIPTDLTGYSNLTKYVNIGDTPISDGQISWLMLNMSYDDSELPSGFNESSIQIAMYNGTWYNDTSDFASSSGVDTVNNYAWANITPDPIGVDTYALLAKEITFIVLQIGVDPNPAIATENNTFYSQWTGVDKCIFGWNMTTELNQPGIWSNKTIQPSVNGWCNQTLYVDYESIGTVLSFKYYGNKTGSGEWNSEENYTIPVSSEGQKIYIWDKDGDLVVFYKISDNLLTKVSD